MQEPTFRASVPLVVAPATVTDGKGKLVDGLQPSDFELLVDGGRIAPDVETIYQPISLVIAVQNNTYAAAVLAKVRKAGSLIEPLITGERGECAVIGYSSEVKLVHDFSSDAGVIKNALAGVPLDEGGSAKMHDAIALATEKLSSRSPNRRRVLILIGESKDRSSQMNLEKAVSLAQRNNVLIYPVTYSAYRTPFTAKPSELPPPEGMNLLRVFGEIGRMAKSNSALALAQYTGGRRISFTTQRALEKTISAIGEELHSQYILAFTPRGASDHQYHSIQVRVAGRPDLSVRTRAGYWMD